MPSEDAYTSSAPPLGFKKSDIKPTSNAKKDSRSANIELLTNKILQQNTYSKWTGQGFGSIYANAKHMATRLVDAGITRLEDFGQRTVEHDRGFLTVKKFEYYNKVTGKKVAGDQQGPGILDVTYAGDGSTRMGVTFNKMGMPIFYTQYNGSSSDWDTFAPILSIASIIPSPIQPFAQAINAGVAFSQGNIIGGVLGSLGAAYSFGAQYSTLDPSSVNYINSMDAASDVAAGVGTSTITTAANWLAANAGTIQTAQQAVGLLNALDKKNLAGIIVGLNQIAPEVGVTIPESAVKPIQTAALVSAAKKGDWVGASMIGSSLLNSSDLALAGRGAQIVKAVKSKNPVEILDSLLDFNQTYKLVQAKDFQDAAKSLGLPMSSTEAARLLKAADGNKELALYKASVDNARKLYKSEAGLDLPDEFFEKNAPKDFLTKADDLYTTKPEARVLWEKELGYKPSDFDLMEIEGLATSDAKRIIDDRGSTTYEEAETFLKDLYGDKYTPTKEEITDLMGLKEVEAKKNATTQYNTWVKDQNEVTNDELTDFLKKAGLKEEDLSDEQILSALKGTESGVQKFLGAVSDLNKNSFDGSKYKTQIEAQNEAIKNGFGSYRWNGAYYTLLPPDSEEKIKADIKSKDPGRIADQIFVPTKNKSLEQQLKEAGNPDEYAYKQGDTIVVVSKRLDVPDYNDTEEWNAFKKEKEALGGDTFQSYLTEKFSILQQAMKGAPDDSVAKIMASAAMWGYGKIANLAEDMMEIGIKFGMKPDVVGVRVAQQIQNWSNKLVSQGVQNAEAAVFANVAAVTKESIAKAQGISPSKVSDLELFWEKSKALVGQVKDNPLGVGLFVAGEGVQEVPWLAISGGVGSILKPIVGKTIAFAAARGTDVALNGLESFAGNFGEVRKYLTKQGVPEEQAYALATKSGLEAMAVSAMTAFVGDRKLVQAFMGDVSKDAFSKVLVANSTKEWLLGNVEGSLQNMSAQIAKYGTIKSKDEWMNAGLMEGLAQHGIATGVLTASKLSTVVAKDYDGKDVTLKQIIDGESTFDPKTIMRNVVLSGNLTLGSALEYQKVLEKTANVSPTEFYAVDAALRNSGMSNITANDIISIAGTTGELKAKEITDAATKYADPFVFDASEVQAAAAAQGYKLTKEELDSLVGQKNETTALADFNKKYDPLAVTDAEARQFFKDIGYTPNAKDVADYVGNKKESDISSAIKTKYDPLAVTEAEARQFFKDVGYDAKPEDIAAYVGNKNQSDVKSQIESKFDPLSVTEAEAKEFFALTGYVPNAKELAAYIGNKKAADIQSEITKKFDPLGVSREEALAAAKAEGYELSDKELANYIGNRKESDTLAAIINYVDPLAVTEAEAKAFFAEQGYPPSKEELIKYIGQKSETQIAKDVAAYADPKAVTAAEAKDFFAKQGYPATDAQIKQFTKVADEVQTGKDIAAYVDPRQVTAAEAEAFLKELGYKPTKEEINKFVTSSDKAIQDAIKGNISKYVDPLLVDKDEVKQAFKDAGFEGVTDADVERFIGQYSEKDLLGKVTDYLPVATYNATKLKIEDVEDSLLDKMAEYEKAGIKRDQALDKAIDDVATDLGKTRNDILDIIGSPAITDDPATKDVNEAKPPTGIYATIDKATSDLGQTLNDRIDQLQKEGLSQYEATQKAISELVQQNTELQGLVGTQGRTATQADIDALTSMLGGQTQADLTYDINQDKQITQADLDLLTSVVTGTNADWRAPAGTIWGGTGLYGQIAANEAQRLADLKAAEEQRLKDVAAQIEREKITGIKTAAGQAGTQLQQILGQAPQALKGLETTTTPIYAGEYGEYFDLTSPFGFGSSLKPSKEKQGSQTGQQATRIATGGYLDDLLDLLR